MEKLKNIFMAIGGFLLLILFAVLGKKGVDHMKEVERLEKEVDDQKKVVAAKKIEVANLEYDLSIVSNDKDAKKKVDKIKGDIVKKKSEIFKDNEKLKTFTSELDKAKVKAEGSIKKVE